MTDERKIEFKIGNLDLVLSPRLDIADFKYLESLCGKVTSTFAEDAPVSDRLAEMLVKCAQDHNPLSLTKERILDEFVMPIHELNSAIAVALLQVHGVIPMHEKPEEKN